MMRPRAFYLGVALVIGAGVLSVQSVDTDFDPSVNFASETADLILKNGAVFTMDANRSQVTAVGVKDGKIIFVGSDTGAEALRGSSTRVVDLEGQMVLPGLHDSHVHLTEGGLATLQCSLTGLTTVQQVLDKVASCAVQHPELTWIVGGGWEATLFPPEGPTHQLLDAVVSNRPVLLYGGDGHSAWLNAEALRLSGITKDIPDPSNGRIERDAAKEPIGTLRESAVDLAVAAAPRSAGKSTRTDCGPGYGWLPSRGLLPSSRPMRRPASCSPTRISTPAAN